MILEGVAPVTSGYATIEPWGLSMGDLQDPKMEVLYHIKAISCGDIPLHSPYIGLIYGRYLQFRFLRWPVRLYHVISQLCGVI